MLQELDQNVDVGWKEWKNEKFIIKEDKEDNPPPAKKKKREDEPTKKKCSTITKKVLHDMEGDMEALINELVSESALFSAHLFNAKWQRDQLKILRHHLPNNWLVCIEDFAENFRTQYQDEIQSAHYQYEQGTVFCIQCYYHCPTCSEEVEESVVCISDDLTHDGHSVNAFHQSLANHLRERQLKIEHKVAVSDGCSSQFKSKLPFLYLLKSKENLGHTTQRSYFGTRHGKSVCDSFGGIIKRGASTHVASRQGKIC